MSADWDSENFVPAPILSSIVNKWDGEDEDLNVKDNWEDDDEDKKKEENKKKPSQQSKKPKSKLEEKIEERERKERTRLRKQELEEEVDFSNMTPEQIQAEKLRRQKIIEEADFEVAKEMLGLNDEDSLLDKMNPKTKEEFTAYKDALCKNILCFKKSEYFPSFIEELFRDLSAGLTLTELKKVKLNLDNMFNEKSRVEKLEKSKKSKGKGKAKLRVEENDMV